jgi:glycosyltransferase 2 family protein
VFLALGLYGDLSKVGSALFRFNWLLLPAILGLTLVNYAIRFLKWHYYMGQLDVPISWRDSLVVFLSGLAMVVTPGKVGEFLKAYLVKEKAGTPMARTMPTVVCERLTDGVAMIVLASAGLVLFGYGWQPLLAIGLLALTVILAVQHRPFAEAALGWGARLPLLRQRMHHLREFYDGAYTLMRFRNLALAVAMGIVSWAGECVAFYLVLRGLGVEGGSLMVAAFFVLAVATLLGSLSLLPGGLGVADGSITGLLLAVTTIGREDAVAATLLIRFCTLWFGVSLGLATLAFSRTRLVHPEMLPAVA